MSLPYYSMLHRIAANSVVDEATGCWNWIGTRKRNGSGKFYGIVSMRVPGKKSPVSVLVHRLVLQLLGWKMDDHVAAHRCNNTLCCNPAHLRRATQAQNIQQAHDEGRAYNSARAA